MGNIIECMAINCKINDKDNEIDSDDEDEKKVITEVDDDEDHYLELQDGLDEYSRHYEENSVHASENSNND